MHGTGSPLGQFSSAVPKDAKKAAAIVADTLRDAKRVLILGHVGADGDVAGASLAMANALQERGANVTVYNEKKYPMKFHFLPGAENVATRLDDRAQYDATVVVDAADPARCGKDFPDSERRGAFVWIDHHQIKTPPGDVNYIDLTAAAVGEQIVEVLDALNHPLSEAVASCVYVSLISDTGGFRYASTSARAFMLAGRCVAAGVDPWEVTTHLFESEEEERVRLLAKALDTLKRSPDGRVGVVRITDAFMEQTGANEGHAHGIVNHVRGIKGVELAILIREGNLGAEIVVRSKGTISAADFAAHFGGGGHRNAVKFHLDKTRQDVSEQIMQAAMDTVAKALGVEDWNGTEAEKSGRQN